MGLGTGGAIALAATIYPTPIRFTGAGWGMAMGRFGQIIGPLVAGVLLGAGWTAGPIMTVTACGGLIGASSPSCSARGSLGGGWKASPPARPTRPSAPCAQQSGRRVNRRVPLALRQAAGCGSGSERCSSLAPN